MTDPSRADSAAATNAASTAAASATPVPPAAASSPTPNISSCCPVEKWRYEHCFQHWYTHSFLRPSSTGSGTVTQLPEGEVEACKDEFNAYRACVIKYYEKHEPEVLVAAGSASDALLEQQGAQPFRTKYPNLQQQAATNKQGT